MIVGIDPGLGGGVALLSPSDQWAVPLPVHQGEVAVRELAGLIREADPALVVIEELGMRRKQSVQSGRTTARNWGMLKATVLILGYPVRVVRPQEWRKAVLPGAEKGKDAAILFVESTYPAINLIPGKRRVPHDGMADAVCLAEWGRQLMAKGVA